MLPILRMTSVGLVLLAVAILVLALRPQNTAHARWSATSGSARGALIAQADHPEWRQFLIQSAVQRAGEIQRLRDLPDTPTAKAQPEPEKAAPKVAGLPADHDNADSDEPTGAIPAPAESTMPMEIGEPSSTELPVAKHEETPPAVTPALLKQRHETRHRKTRAAKKPKPEGEKSPAHDDGYMARANMLIPP
jgi:hypothetical protein